ncbi:biotin--[acetyl-CoA-carboxylase] ligase [Pullulanibacillus sp. KACC 23026]|nr:biotin--[acetyl-CoA-carboxylase] ligase [Pullulanibacillus sp. KACC 23026]WEG14975.1 biotin--[acetyl-CoA-carboxylase] ligase [Pullulanibacillus sp. KACC 23026]
MLLKNQDTHISGQAISEQLGVSRTAVWKQIQGLIELGYEIESVQKLGYRLIRTPDVLTEAEIEDQLETEFLGRSLHIHESIPSTQKLAHYLAEDKAVHGTVILAEEQTGGRGRLGRTWHSPKGTGIWMSLILRPDLPIHKTPQLTLLAAVCVARAVQKVTGVTLEIKWPNDLLYKERKLVGILTELQAEEGTVKSVIIGIGMNVNTTRDQVPEDIASIATSLKQILGHSVSRPALVAAILNELESLYTVYIEEGFHVIKLLWESYAISHGRLMYARTVKGTVIKGMSKGITDDGILLLEDEEGNTHHIYSADIDLSKEE